MQDAGYKMQDKGFRSQEPESRRKDFLLSEFYLRVPVPSWLNKYLGEIDG